MKGCIACCAIIAGWLISLAGCRYWLLIDWLIDWLSCFTSHPTQEWLKLQGWTLQEWTMTERIKGAEWVLSAATGEQNAPWRKRRRGTKCNLQTDVCVKISIQYYNFSRFGTVKGPFAYRRDSTELATWTALCCGTIRIAEQLLQTSMNEWKCEDFKCVWKPTESRLCLTHYVNKSSRWAK